MEKELYHRKDIVKEFHISRRIIENYERLQLIKNSSKDKMGYYLYDKDTVKMIGQIRFLQLLGIRLEQIKEIIQKNNSNYEKQIINKRINCLKEQPKRINKLITAAKLYLDDKDSFLEKETVLNIYKQ